MTGQCHSVNFSRLESSIKILVFSGVHVYTLLNGFLQSLFWILYSVIDRSYKAVKLLIFERIADVSLHEVHAFTHQLGTSSICWFITIRPVSCRVSAGNSCMNFSLTLWLKLISHQLLFVFMLLYILPLVDLTLHARHPRML